ncbi:serine protease [Euzebya pacifica]|uniref:Serine protease n=1 Tax=Euzebya pacifica TaxID=1608957 RepID=A0A346XSA2_9ACTN|nr:trypsin-like peptidase domain-containing protein [Euzebya pacifica]AXV05099.1 serine protease [Euzebya pacifica]
MSTLLDPDQQPSRPEARDADGGYPFSSHPGDRWEAQPVEQPVAQPTSPSAPAYGPPAGYPTAPTYGPATGYAPATAYDRGTGYARGTGYDHATGYDHSTGYGPSNPSGAVPPNGPSATATAADPRRRPWVTPLVSATLAAVVAAGVSFPIARSTVEDTSTAEEVPASFIVDGTGAGDTDIAEAMSISDVAAAVAPSVGLVSVTTRAGQGSGSAVVYGADGLLVTNNHVVADAVSVQVTLPSGETYDAQVVGTDPTTDVAVLRIDAVDLPTVPFATAEATVGETAVAIGSPFGLDGTVTTGIVSATNRTLGGQTGVLGDLIQTDASINPGNSGGALVNGQGELIGLNTAILSSSGTSSGVGFAVPVATVQNVADQILATGSAVHAALGVSGQTVDARTAELYDLDVDAGAVLATVEPGSAAAAAGLQPGDIVTAVDGESVDTIADLSVAIRAHQPGDVIQLDVVRDNVSTTVEATLGEATS